MMATNKSTHTIEKNAATKQIVSHNRRNLTKAALWVAPVVMTVNLPVHAQSSGVVEPAETTEPVVPPNAIELTTSALIDGSTFLAGDSRDYLFVVENISGFDSTAPIEVTIKVPDSTFFTTTLSPATTSSNVFGGIPANNPDWDIVDNMDGTYTVTTKSGIVIAGGGASVIGLTTTAVAPGSDDTTLTITTGTGGADVLSGNNQSQIGFIVNA